MSSSEHLNEVTCSAYVTSDNHYLNQPITLQCGHAVCKNCIPINGKQPIKCKKCGNVTDRDLSNDKESAGLKTLLKFCLPELFIDIEKRFSEGIATIKSTVNSYGETIDVKAKFIEEEIEIQVESMKIELDQLEGSLKDELAQIVKQIKKDQACEKFDDIQIALYESKLDELRDDLKNNQVKNEEKFYSHQESFKSLKKSLRELEKLGNSYQMQFMPSTIKLNASLIGTVAFKRTNKISKEEIKEKLQNLNYETFQLNVQPMQLCSLPNKQFVSINTDGISLYDENLNVIRSLTTIDNQALDGVHGIATNSKNEIYVSNYKNHSILKLDMNLNKIKSFGTRGNNNYQFKMPFGICFKNDRLYVCDSGNRRIQILNEVLLPVGTIELQFEMVKPLTIGISDTSIGVSCADRTGTYFYDINTKRLKNRYTSVVGRMSEIDSYFYVTSDESPIQLSIFDKEGVLIEQVKLDRLNCFHGHLSTVNENMFLTSHHHGQILKF